MPTDIELREIARRLRIFFLTLFDPREAVYIYAKLPLAHAEYYEAHPEELPERMFATGKYKGKVLRFWMNPVYSTQGPPRWIVRRVLDPFRREPGSTSLKLLRQLFILNDMGYEIFFCPQPLTCSLRSHRTVRLVRHLVLEFDNDSLAQQESVLEPYKPYIAAITWSGNKSLHALVRLDPYLWNKNAKGWKQIRGGFGGDADVEDDDVMEWPEHRDTVEYWISLFQEQGILVDSKVIKDFSHVTRLPFFKHAGTGQVAQVRFLNRQARWNRFFDIKDVPSQGCSQQNESNSTCGAESVQRAKNRKGKVGSTDVDTFLEYAEEHLERYRELKNLGIPCRHTRLSCHKYLFTAAVLYGWDDDRLAAAWRHIVSLHPENIGCSINHAVKDILSEWHKRTHRGFYLPDLGKLPSLTKRHRQHMAHHLELGGCPEPSRAARIIRRVILPLVQTMPHQCQSGTVGISSVKIRNAARTPSSTRYRHILTWMHEQGLVVCTNARYVATVQTRTYRVNIPLLLLLLGYRTEELDWSLAEPWRDVLSVA